MLRPDHLPFLTLEHPCASTPSHSCAGGVRRPDTTSTALGECASVDVNGAANNAAEILAASIL